LGSTCCHSVQNLFSSRLLSRSLNIKRYIIIILPVVVCETWFAISREEHRMRVLENRVLRRIFGPKREDVAGG
jgi:hypothetical protein